VPVKNKAHILARWSRLIGGVVVTIATTLFGLLLVTFLIGRVVPIDPVLAVVGDKASHDVYEAARVSLGLDKPIWVQFLLYVGNVLHGDFGMSALTKNSVITDIGRVFPATLELATTGMMIGLSIGLPLGIIAAVNQGRPIDHLARLIGLMGYSLPSFWLGLVALLVFYAKLGWVAGPGRMDIAWDGMIEPRTGLLVIDAILQGEWEAASDAVSHLILPASILGIVSLAYISRMMRSFMITELKNPYVTAARVKGLPEWQVVLRHVLPNAIVPLVTVIALSYALLLEGSVLVETIFAWPGLGRYITNALLNADMNAVLGGTVVVGAVFVLVNLTADVVGRLADPRV
jgi:peptide/nickel transport system permease protein